MHHFTRMISDDAMMRAFEALGVRHCVRCGEPSNHQGVCNPRDVIRLVGQQFAAEANRELSGEADPDPFSIFNNGPVIEGEGSVT